MSEGFHDLESRVRMLEYQMRFASGEAAEARVLARAADRDVSIVHAAANANQHVINALRQTQLEQGEKLDALDRKVDNLTGVVAEHGLTLAEHSATLAEHGRKLDALDEKIDSRFDEVVSLLRQR